jgi:hypothetical protein
MGDLIHLGRARKRRAAEQKAAQADANAVRHGQTRNDRDRAAAEARRETALLDGARLEPTGEPAADDDPSEPTP